MTDDPNSRGEDILARIRAQSDWADLRAQVLHASALRRLGVPPVKIGRFDAIVCIGEGGFGTVFRARDPKLDRLVALKLCRTRSPIVVQGIMNEAKALAQLEHANIVTIFELGEHDGAVFFAMRYLAGKNAERFAERDPPPTCEQIVDVYRGVASGLAAAHAKKFVHGDIKPSNILLDDDDTAYIADFGLAQRMIDGADESEQEELRQRAGTLYYMAPEALRGEPINALTDQFSFCVALYQTLTRGSLPFEGNTSAELLDDIEHTDVRELIDPSWPAVVQVVLRIGLSLDPHDRFPDMATLKAELDRMRQTPPSSEPEPEEPEPEEPEQPEPEEPEGPERMHEPGRSDQLALMVGEPAGLVESSDSGPSWVIDPNAPAVVRVGVSSVPAPSARRTASWVAFGAACVALGSALTGALALLVLGPASDATASVDVELPEPSELPEVSKPIELPYPHNLTSPCAMGDEEVSIADEELLKTCTQIRNGHLGSAQTGWDSAVNRRRLSGDHASLIEHTLIVARTFIDHAIVIQRAGPVDAAQAAILGYTWAGDAAHWIDPHEGLNDPRVSPIRAAAKPLLPR